MQLNLLGLGKTTLTCLPATAAEERREVSTVGVGPACGRGADAALPRAETGVLAEAGGLVSALAIAAGRLAAGKGVARARSWPYHRLPKCAA